MAIGQADGKAEFRGEKYLSVITGLFVAVLLISNIASVKIVDLGPLIFDGGTILFPLSYIFGDILTEVYGYKRARKVIWTGFASALLMSIVFAIISFLPADPSWTNQAAYDTILGVVPRIVIASLIAYFAGEFSNSYILAKMKIWSKGKKLWQRTIGSTIVGEGVDTILFATIAFFGTMPFEVFIMLVISNYIFKVGIEVLFTPVTYIVVNFLKKEEQKDVYDYNTNFSPFTIQ
jgi:hypothetical protein